MNNYLDLSITEINKLLKEKKILPIDLVNEAIDRIEKNSDLNCFITLNKEEALKCAKELENKEVDNLLFGLPIAIKDNICTKNIRTTCASKMLENFVPVYDAFVISKLKEKGMIIIGKLNMDEFACGSTNRTSYFGNVLNPWDKTCIPGGSSGGAAACVSARLTPFALGTDTGGSIRQPSSMCGIVGLKPTYGRASRYGLIAFSSSLDQIGPMTRNVYENALLLNAISGKDNRDLTSFDTNEDFTSLIGEDIKDLKIAIPKFYVSNIINEEILNKFNEVCSMLKKSGVIIDIVDVPYLENSVSLYQIIALGELSSNLARFDGIKYGYSSLNASCMEEVYTKTRSEGFGEEVKRRIMVGSFLLSGENAKTYYDKALSIRDDMRKSFLENFKKYDLIIGPTTTTVAYGLDENLTDPSKTFMDDVLVIPVNMAGLPGLNLPIGFNKDNMPIGLHIIGNSFDEATIYKFASFVENKLNLSLNPGKEEK